MSDKELIAEARAFLGSDNAQYYDASLIGDLVKALEARQERHPFVQAGIDRAQGFADGLRGAVGPDVRDHLHAKCDCVPDLGPAHCHLCSGEGSPVPWSECSAVVEARQVDEAAVADVIEGVLDNPEYEFVRYVYAAAPSHRVARAVIEFLGERHEPEQPLGSEFLAAAHTERQTHATRGWTIEHDRKHGVDHLLRLALNYLANDKPVKAGSLIIAARELAGERHEPNVQKDSVFDNSGGGISTTDEPEPVKCDYCGDELPSVKHRSHIPTTPDLQRRGFAADKIVCSECAKKPVAPQPSESDVRERMIESIAGGTISVPGGYGSLAQDDAENIVDAILAAFPTLSRAAAPTETGAGLIAAERARQVSEEGYSAEHDRGQAEQLVAAGLAYASAGRREIQGMSPGMLFIWPWADEFYKPTGDPRRDLTKAGALIAAAIDALPIPGGEGEGL